MAKKIALITGSAGLIGSESTRFFCDLGFDVVGVDNNMRKFFLVTKPAPNGVAGFLKMPIKIIGIIAQTLEMRNL